jgi:riboflavin-specific deaminase-like protein
LTNEKTATQTAVTASQETQAAPGRPDTWPTVLKSFDDKDVPLPEPWGSLFGPLRHAPVAVGQVGQSLDGRIATENGHSHYINGPAGLDHLHRLRALMDAVVVGIGTAIADDPQLTVRRVQGRSPARVVIDPRGRLPATARFRNPDGTRKIVVTKAGVTPTISSEIEHLPIVTSGDDLAPAEILAALEKTGLRRVLIEGGANTVSRFLAAGCLDRLHIVVAPVIFGSGRSGIALPPIARADEAMRPPIHVHRLGDEVLYDCDLSAQRAEGRAKKST